MGNGQFCDHKFDDREAEAQWLEKTDGFYANTLVLDIPYNLHNGQSLNLPPGWSPDARPPGASGPQKVFSARQWRVSLLPAEVPIDLSSSQASNASTQLGFRLFDAPRGAVVFSVDSGGMVDFFNSRSPDKAIWEGDMILEVNGAAGTCRAINHAVLAGRPLDLKIERRTDDEVEWIVEIDGGHGSLGVQFDTPSPLAGSTLRVARGKEERSRFSANASNSIRRGDLIHQVNTESASAAAMAAEMKKARSLRLRVSRKKMKHVVQFQKDLIDDVFSDELIDDGFSPIAASCVPGEPDVTKPYQLMHHVAR
jgi:hypothetical protein